MCARDESAAQRKRTADDALDSQMLHAEQAADDVDDRVFAADFVQVHLFKC